MPLNPFVRQFESSFSPRNWTNVRTLIAVSGGPDSVAMLCAMSEIGRRSSNWDRDCLIVGHFNHGTRGPDSNDDARFVETLAEQHGLPFRSLVCKNAYDATTSEETLRNSRYQALIQLAQTEGARYLVTGHNQDDQIETILFRILRGTGLTGLAGIPRQRLASQALTLVRPMLNFQRSEIEAYLADIGQAFRRDPSNGESRYTRNFLRNDVIPDLKARFGESVSDAILRLSAQAREIDDYLLVQTRPLASAIVERSRDKLVVDCQKLQSSDVVLVRRWLMDLWRQQNWPEQAMSFQWWQKLAAAIQSTNIVVHNLPGSIRFAKGEQFAEFSEINEQP